MVNKGIRTVPLLLFAVLSILWGIILIIEGAPAVVSWWLIQVFGLVGFIVFIRTIWIIFRTKSLRVSTILTIPLSLIAIWPLLWFFGIGAIAWPQQIEKASPAVSIRSPFNKTVLTGWGGDSLETNYHAVVPVERWAYDIIRLPASTGSPHLEDYGIFGLDVIAPADGTIVEMRTDLPDLIPGESPDKLSEMKGNYIYIRLTETGTYLLLAHFMKDSILVEVGEHVSEGDLLGKVGNSGNSSEPHLHIHHQKDNPLTSSLFTARGLPLYIRQQGGDRIPAGGIITRDGKDIPCGEEIFPYTDKNKGEKE